MVFYRESRGDCDRSVIYGSVVKTSYINPMPYDCEIASIIRAMQEGELLREIGRFKLAGEKFMEAIKLSVKLYEAEWLSRLLYLYVQNVLERGDKILYLRKQNVSNYWNIPMHSHAHMMIERELKQSETYAINII